MFFFKFLTVVISFSYHSLERGLFYFSSFFETGGGYLLRSGSVNLLFKMVRSTKSAVVTKNFTGSVSFSSYKRFGIDTLFLLYVICRFGWFLSCGCVWMSC